MACNPLIVKLINLVRIHFIYAVHRIQVNFYQVFVLLLGQKIDRNFFTRLHPANKTLNCHLKNQNVNFHIDSTFSTINVVLMNTYVPYHGPLIPLSGLSVLVWRSTGCSILRGHTNQVQFYCYQFRTSYSLVKLPWFIGNKICLGMKLSYQCST